MQINPNSIAFFNSHTVLEFSEENTPNVDTFLVELIKNKAYLRFDCLEDFERSFIATDVITNHHQLTYPVVADIGVLWEIKAAVRAAPRLAALHERFFPEKVPAA